MTSYMFSKSQLEKLRATDLLKLAQYYEIKYSKKTTKVELIEKILHAQKPFDSNEVESENVSVRVRRIRESNKQS